MIDPRDEQRVIDILTAIYAIEEYVAAQAALNDALADAIKCRLIVIGEASGALSKESQERASDVPWTSIKAFRNLLVHEYNATDPQRLHSIVTFHLPQLKDAVIQLSETYYSN